MKAWHILKRGTTQDLHYGELPEPTGPGTRVRILGAALNPADQKVLRGKEGGKFLHANRYPIQLGYDFSGRTDAGEEVFGFLPYLFTNAQGTFSEWIRVPEDSIAPRPKNVTPAQAASLATGALTALQALRDIGNLRPGDHVLVNGASGGVGTLAVQIAKKLGARVTATCSREKMELVKSLGADEVVDYRARKIQDLPPGFAIVFDAAASSRYQACKSILAPRGVYITTLPSPSLLIGFLESLVTGQKARFVSVKSRRPDLELVARWTEEGALRPVVDREFKAAEVPAAMDYLATGQAKGKIAVEMGN